MVVHLLITPYIWASREEASQLEHLFISARNLVIFVHVKGLGNVFNGRISVDQQKINGDALFSVINGFYLDIEKFGFIRLLIYSRVIATTIIAVRNSYAEIVRV